MLKAIIADDEKKVCQMIQKLIDWGSLGYEIVGIAHSGPDAYDLIDTCRPDVVITDIRMPGFGGIELVKKIKEKGLSPYFIIISGYKYFEYAHDAIKYGVENYLLKPIDQQELIETLLTIKKRYMDEHDKVADEQRIQNELAEQRSKMRKHFINDIIFNNKPSNNLEIELVNEEYQLHFQQGVFQALFFKLDYQLPSEFDIENILNKLGDMTEKEIDDYSLEHISVQSQSGLVFVVNYPVERANSIKHIYEHIFEEVQNYLDNFGCFSFTMGVGEVQMSIKDVSISIGSAVDAVKCRIVCGVNRILYHKDLKFETVSMSAVIPPKKKSQLENIVETMDSQNFKVWVQDVIDTIHQIPNYNPCIIFEIFKEVKEVLSIALKRQDTDFETMMLFGKTYDEILDSGIHEISILKNIQNYVCTNLDAQREKQLQMDIRPIRLAKQYVQMHYMDPISLDEVAGVVHLNASYFSVAFKKEVGMNFIDYLIACRIDAAKAMLKTTNESMAVIAEKIGYTDTKYFSKLFTKTVGIKPSEYRKLYS